MPMVAIRGRRRSLCAMLQGPVKRGAQGAGRAQLAPPPLNGRIQAPCDGRGHQGPSAGAGQPGRWVPVAQ